MNKKKIDINSTEPINSIAEVDSAVDEFVKRGGYITLEEDLKIRKRITSRNHLADIRDRHRVTLWRTNLGNTPPQC